MARMSILYQDFSAERVRLSADTISDLLIEKFIERVISSGKRQNLETYFLTPLRNPDELYYRQEIFKDLESRTVARWDQEIRQRHGEGPSNSQAR